MKILLPVITLALFSCATNIPVPPIFATIVSSDTSLSTKTFRDVNAYRGTKGKPPLQRHSGLDQLALQHSQDMMNKRGGKSPKNIVNHDGFGHRASIAQYKYHISSIHENAAVAPRGFSLVDVWRNSRGHEVAMRGSWSCTGVGVVVDSDGMVFATQLFGDFEIPRTGLQTRRSFY